jgi:pimeloyl-ACP methyl ester carboxylesterase
VLVHGLVVSSRSTVPAARALARLAPVAAPDLPGFGRTPGPRRALDVAGLARALARWVDAARPGRAVLVANSLGCQVAVRLAVERPGLVAALVLTGPTGDPAARSPWGHARRWLADVPRERPSLAAVVAADLVASGPRRAAATYAAMLTDEPERALPSVAAPVLVVRGEHDTVAPPAWAAEVARLAPRGRTATVPGGAHTLVHGWPGGLAAAVARFLAEEGLTGPFPGPGAPPAAP